MQSDPHRVRRPALAGVAPSAAEAVPAGRDLADLVRRVADGSREALEQLFDLTHRLVFSNVIRILGDPDLSEEVTLGVFRFVWRRAERFDSDRGRVTTWLMTIARTRAIDARRSADARRHYEVHIHDGMDEAHGLESSETAPDAALEELEESDVLRRALARLTEAQRSCIELAFFQGLNHREVADRLDLPLGTAKSHIRRGLAQLAEILQDDVHTP